MTRTGHSVGDIAVGEIESPTADELRQRGDALANLMLYVSAAPRHRKPDDIEFPVLRDLFARRSTT